MLRTDYRGAISQAVSDISNIPSLDERNKASITQAVVLRLLSAAGWNVFDLSEVLPEYRRGNSSVSLALMSPPSGPFQGSAVTPGVR